MVVTTDDDNNAFLTADEMRDTDSESGLGLVNLEKMAEQTSPESTLERSNVRPQRTLQAPNRLTYDYFGDPKYNRIP